ncbi:MAG: sigma-54-dependent Fis family transcriptional regulator, partial [Proteobacteria bacterium]|nr:sigma-54-dependent Fis family transcriptional regulator [Pseudomonadota bacterium]
SAESGAEAWARAEEEPPDVAILDVEMPRVRGDELAGRFKSHPELRYTPVILLTANSEADDIEAGLAFGADDYVIKPFERRELLARVGAALRIRALYQELRSERLRGDSLQSQVEERFKFGNLVGRSAPMRAVYDLLEKVKDSRVAVLITGESGTGKELVASAIHYNSNRRTKPFIAHNCSAFSETLLESELFGHVRGAFTGALRDKPGIFELADGGTLFLDEIGEMKAALQAKLLRVLQEGTFTPVGGTKQRHVDVRVVAATNRDLEKMIKDGSFREDLYYRLNVIRVALPPLRERPGDVASLVPHFLSKIATREGSSPKSVHHELLALLCAHSWPGNVRELENEIERLWLMSGADAEINPEHADPRLRRSHPVLVRQELSSGSLAQAVEQLERGLLQSTLERTGWNKSEAARLLGISRSNLIEKVKQYGLEPQG